MSTEIASAEIQLFYSYLGRRLSGGRGDITPEESVRDFRKYQAELNRFVEETKRSEQQSINGEAKPLDMDALRLRLEKRLADERLAAHGKAS